MNYLQIFVSLIIGTVTGVFISSIGIGAGLVTIPALIFFGMAHENAVIITLLLQLLPQTVPAIYNFWKDDKLSMELIYFSLILLVGNLIGTYFGSLIHTKDLISDKTLYKCLFTFLLISAFSVYYQYLRD